jgi:hypothetical protein
VLEAAAGAPGAGSEATGGSSATAQHANHLDADAINVAKDDDDNATTSPQVIVPPSISAPAPSPARSSLQVLKSQKPPGRAAGKDPKRNQRGSWHPPMTTSRPNPSQPPAPSERSHNHGSPPRSPARAPLKIYEVVSIRSACIQPSEIREFARCGARPQSDSPSALLVGAHWLRNGASPRAVSPVGDARRDQHSAQCE